MNHTDTAESLFSKKYYCSQAVLAAFSEELGMPRELALKVGACFGAGMCKAEVCGACTGALMALGLKYGMHKDGDLESKENANSYAVRFLEKFAEKNGSYICRELLGCDISTDEGRMYARQSGLFTEKCPEMIKSAVLIAEELIGE